MIEIVIAAGIIAMVVAAGVAVSLGARSFAVSTASAEFDHLLDSARTIARETQGATLVFAPDAYGDGTEVRVLTTGPNDTLVATTMPIVRTRAAIEEAALGRTPFAFVIHASGALGGRPGYKLGDATATGEVGCPATGTFRFVIRAAGASAERVIPCRISLAATGPIAFAPWPPAVVSAPPTPCGGPCLASVLPTPPSSSPTCPPGFTPSPGGCAPPTEPNGARYHVSASPAVPTIAVGGSTRVTAQATLTNASAVAPGTPSSVAVLVQQISDAVCSATPPGAQPSGAPFVVTALSAGRCAVTIGAEITGIPGATADTASVTITVTSSPNPTPSPRTCDLFDNGKCYHRIVNRTSHMFYKHVVPDTNCSVVPPGAPCNYVDSIKEIFLEPGFGFQAPVPPTDADHEILVRFDSVIGVSIACMPYSAFAANNPDIPLSFWQTGVVGAPVNPRDGLGEPATFMTSSHFIVDASPTGVFGLNSTWNTATTLAAAFSALATGSIGLPADVRYSGGTAAGKYIELQPDFPGCDAAGDINSPGLQYGNAGVGLLLEVYQAVP